MKFSVIVPAHNSAEFIRVCLDSIKNQSFKDYELIVVCDACEDNTEEIAREYTKNVISVDVRSDGLARNAGLDIAKGDWVLFIDSDDWWLHEFVFEQLAGQVGRREEDILIFDFVWKHIGVVGARSSKGTLYTHCTNKCWNRKFIGKTRFPSKYVANDASFCEQMMSKNPKIFEWDMPLYYYNYLRDGSKSKELGRTTKNTKLYWSTH